MTSKDVNSWSQAALEGKRAPFLGSWPDDSSLTWCSQTAASLCHHYSANKQSSTLKRCLQPDQESVRSSTPSCRCLRAPNTFWTESKQRWPPYLCTRTQTLVAADHQSAMWLHYRATAVVRLGSSTSSSHSQCLFLSIIIPNMQLVGAPAALIKRLTADGSTSSIIELKCEKRFIWITARGLPPNHFISISLHIALTFCCCRLAQRGKVKCCRASPERSDY